MTAQSKQFPKFFFLLLAPAFLLPLRSWLRHQNDPYLFLGLSSKFWTGVTIGVSIASTCLFLVFLLRSNLRPGESR